MAANGNGGSGNETIFTMEATPLKYGRGASEEVGWEVKRLGVNRVMLISDPGVIEAGITPRIRELIEDAGIEVERPGEAPRDAVIAFVALDLLQVDGQSLFEVPLLERKRLLESLVAQSERVRVSVHTRPPVDPWVASWKGAGFRGVMLKAANGRYSPGGYADDWTTITRIHQRR